MYQSNGSHKLFSILDGLKLMCLPDAVYELRSPKTAKGTLSGFFTDLERMAYFAGGMSGQVPAVYLTLNPVKQDYLAIASNRMKQFARKTPLLASP